MADLKYKDITEKIIGASFEVHEFLGNACLPVRQGFQEVIYQSAWWGFESQKYGGRRPACRRGRNGDDYFLTNNSLNHACLPQAEIKWIIRFHGFEKMAKLIKSRRLDRYCNHGFQPVDQGLDSDKENRRFGT
jgi:hypothetical protein